MPETQLDPAGTTRTGYEIGNALGSLWNERPRLAALCTRRHNYALAIQTYLRAVDFFIQQNGLRARRVRVETFIDGDRIVQRFVG